ncbi:MAG: glycosyltransferase family 4 protein [Bacteroidales bacterium]|nr:glycosyltransferase family 4 protein [Bacteroidales bacterium]
MKILYDHQMFTMQRFGGVTRYFAELMACLPTGFEACLPQGLWSDNYYLEETVGYASRVLKHPRAFRLRRRLYYFMNQGPTVCRTRRDDYDVLHPTWYDPYVLRRRRKPLVITVHDLIQERMPGDFRFYDRSILHKKKLMLAADHIIAVSHCTKADIVSIAGIAPEKISVVHHGYRLAAHLDPAPPLGTHYVLYVGDRRKYKNFMTFVEAMAPLLRADRRLSVICAGAPCAPEENALFVGLGLNAGRFQAVQATDAQLVSLYRHADVFVYPSLYEGFGIPILEAFANGCPVCLSRASSFPEVAGEAAVYFEPTSAEDMRLAIERVVYDAEAAGRLRDAGLERVKLFSIDKMVAGTCDVYRRFEG